MKSHVHREDRRVLRRDAAIVLWGGKDVGKGRSEDEKGLCEVDTFLQAFAEGEFCSF